MSNNLKKIKNKNLGIQTISAFVPTRIQTYISRYYFIFSVLKPFEYIFDTNVKSKRVKFKFMSCYYDFD